MDMIEVYYHDETNNIYLRRDLGYQTYIIWHPIYGGMFMFAEHMDKFIYLGEL